MCQFKRRFLLLQRARRFALSKSLSNKSIRFAAKVWLVLRYMGQVTGLLIACIGASQYFGTTLADCGWQCKEVRTLWFAPFFSLASVVVPIGAIAFLAKGDAKWYRRVAISQGILALVAFSLLAANRWSCAVCLSIQFVWIGLALEIIRYRLVAVFAYALMFVGGFNVISEMNDNSISLQNGPTDFKSRSSEQRISGLTFVVFTDPLCPACRIRERELQSQEVKAPLLTRWKLLPRHGDLALRIASAIESAWAMDRQKGNAFFRAIYGEPVPTKDEEIVSRGVACGFDRTTVIEWMKNPEPSSLQIIRQDGDMANKLHVDVVPSLAQVSINIAGGPPRVSRLDAAGLKILLASRDNQSVKGLSIFLPHSQHSTK